MKNLLAIMMLLITTSFVLAFEVDNEVLEQYISTITEEETEDNSTEIADKIEHLAERLRFGIDLNTITKEEFNELGIISPKAVSEIMNYRHTFYHFTTIYELKNIESLTAHELETLKPLVYVSLPEKEKKSKTKIESYTFFSRVIETRKGYTEESTNPYAGDANRLMQKLTIQKDNKLKIGLTTEKDPGELYHHRKWMPLDHCAGYIEVNDFKAFKRTIVGDFRLNFGSGLVFGNYITFKYQNYPKSNGLYHAGNQAESNYFRGLATEIAGQRLKFTPFISYHTIDATLNPDGSFSSFYTNGLHRTKTERSKADNTKELVTGGDLSFTIRKFTIGATGSYYKFSRLYHPQDKPYNFYKPTDTDHGHNLSLHYSLMGRNAQWAGEVATSSNGGVAIINQIYLTRSNFMNAKIAHRYYSPDYYAPYANAVKENTRVENEHGMLAALDFYPSKRFSLKLYADIFAFDWIKYTASTPSYGSEFSSQAYFIPHYKHILSLRYRYKNKQKDWKEHLVDAETNTLKFCYKFRPTKQLYSKTTVIANAYSIDKNANTYGLYANEQISYTTPKNRLNTTLLYTYFSAKEYANRIYCYEKDIDTFYSPFNYGEGHRASIVLTLKCTPILTFSIKYIHTSYIDGRNTISSSTQEISGRNMNEIKAALRLNW